MFDFIKRIRPSVRYGLAIALLVILAFMVAVTYSFLPLGKTYVWYDVFRVVVLCMLLEGFIAMTLYARTHIENDR